MRPILHNECEINLPDLVAMTKFGLVLAKALEKGAIIFLLGDLGAGKTTLTREVLRALGHNGTTKSPTYTLVESYQLPQLVIQHFDLYRIVDPEELEFMGIRDYIDGNAVCIFEWPQKGGEHLPAADLDIMLEISGGGRKAKIFAKTPKGEQILRKCLESLNE